MKDKDFKMADLGEFGFIRSIQDHCRFSRSNIIQGIGDDCAVIGPYEGKVFLVTTDLLLEDIHFILEKTRPEYLGEKALSVNLSDIAAMGGTALHAFVSLAVPKSMPVDTVHAFYRGLKNTCKKYGVDLLGGDTSASPDRLMVNVTVIGEAPQKEVLFRKGAKPGDRIYVTGAIGNSAGGLAIILGKASAPKPLASVLINAHDRPQPFLEAGRLIAQSRLASAMIDLSDGLGSDLSHICESSHVGARLSQRDLPISKDLQTLAEINGFDPYALALAGGEDYCLLITVPEKNTGAFLEMLKKGTQGQISCVGEITEGSGIEIMDLDGVVEHLTPKGFDHFMGQ